MLSKEAMALGALTDHPDWTDKQIAGIAGCPWTELYRVPKYKFAKAAMKAGKSNMPKGSKDAESGDMEAWDGDE